MHSSLAHALAADDNPASARVLRSFFVPHAGGAAEVVSLEERRARAKDAPRPR